MKIKLLTLLTIFTFTSSIAVATSDEIKFSNSKNYLKSVSKETAQRDETLEPFDFKNVFDRAERYFKDAKSWKKLKCEPQSGFICTKHACKERDMNIFLILDKKTKTISRCDEKECESFAADFKQTGAFFNIQTEGPIGTLVRVLGDSRYKEITTVGLDAYIANGNCTVMTD